MLLSHSGLLGGFRRSHRGEIEPMSDRGLLAERPSNPEGDFLDYSVQTVILDRARHGVGRGAGHYSRCAVDAGQARSGALCCPAAERRMVAVGLWFCRLRQGRSSAARHAGLALRRSDRQRLICAAGLR
jgi:hypothetical protein